MVQPMNDSRPLPLARFVQMALMAVMGIALSEGRCLAERPIVFTLPDLPPLPPAPPGSEYSARVQPPVCGPNFFLTNRESVAVAVVYAVGEVKTILRPGPAPAKPMEVAPAYCSASLIVLTGDESRRSAISAQPGGFYEVLWSRADKKFVIQKVVAPKGTR